MKQIFVQFLFIYSKWGSPALSDWMDRHSRLVSLVISKCKLSLLLTYTIREMVRNANERDWLSWNKTNYSQWLIVLFSLPAWLHDILTIWWEIRCNHCNSRNICEVRFLVGRMKCSLNIILFSWYSISTCFYFLEIFFINPIFQNVSLHSRNSPLSSDRPAPVPNKDVCMRLWTLKLIDDAFHNYQY